MRARSSTFPIRTLPANRTQEPLDDLARGVADHPGSSARRSLMRRVIIEQSIFRERSRTAAA